MAFPSSQPRWVSRVIVVMMSGVLLTLVGCSDDDDTGSGEESDRSDAPSPPVVDARFCDAYLDYLAESSPANLDVVVDAADDGQVSEYAEIIASDADITRVLAATLDLDERARSQCQPEWIAGVQGAGSTGAAAQAFFDAVVAGDRAGAANVASANAIAVFEPWEPVVADPDAGTPSLGEVSERLFSMVLSSDDIVQCEVATGVVVVCVRAE